MESVPRISQGVPATRREFLSASAALALLTLNPTGIMADDSFPVTPVIEGLLSRTDHGLVPIRGGRLLLMGGNRDGPLSDCRIFDIGHRTWTRAAPMNLARMNHAAVVLPTGRVLVAGGWNQGPLSDCEIYNPNDDTWTTAAPLNVARTMTAGASMSFGALVTGGLNRVPLSITEMYDHAADYWDLAGNLKTARYGAGACNIGQSILVAGGVGNSALASTEEFEVGTGTWSPGPWLPMGIAASAMATHQGSALLVGGITENERTSVTYRILDGEWVSLAPLSLAIYAHGLAVVPDGRAFSIGGRGTELKTSSVRVYTPATNQWKTIA